MACEYGPIAWGASLVAMKSISLSKLDGLKPVLQVGVTV